MPFLILIIGLVLIATGTRGSGFLAGRFFGEDLFGDAGALRFMTAFVLVGALGFIKPLETPSRLFLALMIVSLVLGAGKNGLIEKSQVQWKLITEGLEGEQVQGEQKSEGNFWIERIQEIFRGMTGGNTTQQPTPQPQSTTP